MKMLVTPAASFVRRPRRNTLRQFAMLALALLAQFGFASIARAQGTMGAVPDPISSRELDDYARRLGLSAQQRGALEQFHEAYKEQFSALRDGEIEKYLTAASGAGNGGGGGGQGGQGGRNGGGMGGRGGGGGNLGIGMLFGGTDRKTIEESARTLNSINERIKSLDNSLFDQIQALLTEDQTLLLNSVRQARERQRYRTGLSRMAGATNPSTQVDLTELLSNITLSPDEKTNISPLIAGYEGSLTTATKKLHDEANGATTQIIEKLQKAGFDETAMQDPQRRGQMFEAFRTIWQDIMTKINEKASDISELNRKTERSMTGVLAKDNSRKLKDSFFRRAYPELRTSTNTSRAFEIAMKLDDLTAEQKAAITAMYDQYNEGVDHLNDELADAIDAQRKSRTAFDFGGGGGGGRGGQGGGRNGGGNGGGGNAPTDEQMNKLREQRQALADSTRTQMESTLGPDLTAKLQKRVADARDQQRNGGGGDRVATFTVVGAPGVAISGGAAGATQVFTANVSGDMLFIDADVARDPFVPAAISGRDIDSYSKRLGLDDERRNILTGLHAEYSDQFKQIDETQIQAVRDASDNLWARNPDGGRPTPPTPEAVDHLYTLRREAIASIKTLDEQFFNDVQVAVMTDEQKPLLDRVRNTRLRAIYNRGNSGSNGMFSIGGGGGGGGGRGPGGGGGGGGGPGGRGGPGGGGPGGGGAMRIFGGGFGGSSESGVDLSVLVEQTKLTPADPKALDSTLADYETSATAAFQIMFETSMRLRQATDRMSGQFQRTDRGGGTTVTINAGDEMRKAMETDGKAAREAGTAISTLNRETLDRLLTQLDATNADSLRRAYNRKAFPDVYRDSRSAEPHLTAAMALPDLSDQQRDQLQGMTLEFRSAYDALCDQMIEIEKSNAAVTASATGGGGQGAGGFDLQAMQERMRNREKLDFERNDLSDKMLARLRASLNEEQVQRLGLDTPAGSY